MKDYFMKMKFGHGSNMSNKKKQMLFSPSGDIKQLHI